MDRRTILAVVTFAVLVAAQASAREKGMPEDDERNEKTCRRYANYVYACYKAEADSVPLETALEHYTARYGDDQAAKAFVEDACRAGYGLRKTIGVDGLYDKEKFVVKFTKDCLEPPKDGKK